MIIYDLLYFLLLLISIPLWGKVLFRKEYRRILGRRIFPRFAPVSPPGIWIHAVSVGEVRSLDLLIHKLKPLTPSITLSVTTPSGYRYARGKYRQIQVIHAPLDLSTVIRKYLRRIRPKLLILNELEVWPNWIALAKKQNVPILLINGRISRRAFRMYSLFRFLLIPTFRKIDRFLIQSSFYIEKFRHFRIPDSKIRVTGNIKADQAADLKNHLTPGPRVFEALKTAPPEKKILVAASTHPADEEVLFPALPDITAGFSVIIVPRHPRRSARLVMELRKTGISAVRWSRAQKIDLDREVLVYDQIGRLFDILSIAHRVIMGGTFDEKIGGHNLYEPLALEKPIFGGPFYNNFPDIGAELTKAGIYRIARDSRQLAEHLHNFSDSGTFQRAARQIFTRRTGSVECTLTEIRKALSRSSC